MPFHLEFWKNFISKDLYPAYDRLTEAIADFAPSVMLTKKGDYLSFREINVVLQAVVCDHPEFFYIRPGKIHMLDGSLKDKCAQPLTLPYSMTKEQAKRLHPALESATSSLLKNLPKSSGDFEKALYLHDVLVSQTHYDASEENEQDLVDRKRQIIGVLLDHTAVCAGYARSFSYLCKKAGICCGYLSGKLKEKNENHAWNMLLLGKDFYHVDVTWDDASTNSKKENDETVYHGYFCITDKEIEKSRDFSLCPVEKGRIPKANAIAMNYFVHTDRLLKKADKDSFLKAIETFPPENDSLFCFKCETDRVYRDYLSLMLREDSFSPFIQQLFLKYRRKAKKNFTSFSQLTQKETNVVYIRFE